MEQRSEHQYMPLGGAATDPAYVPGLVPPRAAAQEAKPLSGEPVVDGDAEPDADEGGRAAVTTEAGADEGGRAKVATEAGAADGATETAEAEARNSESASEGSAASDAQSDVADGPSCEIADRVGSIVAGRGGVRLRLMDEEADFRWDEISAVEYRTPRWTRRFEVVVYTPNHRRFSHDIQATDRATLTRWTEQLDAVLDAYFED
ncbi:hypothetical protein [Streptomyces sp. NPDC006691]|uniref:hypothetical protein n=1 Tax=Streptomyces sp. NPDC006691 TaxID=3364757 RepID=UPI00369DA49B